MEILKFENAPAPRKTASKKSNLKSLAGLATVAAVAVLGSTLAANISLGTGSAIEFGQGVQVATACDSAITLSPRANFVNGANPVFMLSTIGFTDVDARTTGQGSTVNGGTGCAGITLTLNAYGDTSATPLQLATVSSSAVSVATIGIRNGQAPTTSTGFVIANSAGTSTATSSFDLGMSIPSATAGAVFKLTLQSGN